MMRLMSGQCARGFAKVVLCGALAMCWTAPVLAADTPYNKGVQAWQQEDFAEARRQWALSVSRGGPDEALNNLGFLYFHGRGGPVDAKRAIELWYEAATHAVSEAQYHLGHGYQDGQGIARSLPLAYAWFRCAVATTDQAAASDAVEKKIGQDAKNDLAQLLPQLSAAELAQGQELAQAFIRLYAAPTAKRKQP